MTVVVELLPMPEVLTAVRAVADWPALALLDSAAANSPRGRYSFLTADPLERTTVERAELGCDPFATPRRWLADSQKLADTDHSIAVSAVEWLQDRSASITERHGTTASKVLLADLPPFRGGVVGHLSYELGGCWERVPQPTADEFAIPVLTCGLYDWTLAWDHQAHRCWLIARGWSGDGPADRRSQAEARIVAVLTRLQAAGSNGDQPRTAEPATVSSSEPPTAEAETVWAGTDVTAATTPTVPRSCSAAVPQYPTAVRGGVFSSFSRDGYLAALSQVIDYIHAGDIFQANLTQRLWMPLPCGIITLYDRLRRCNPAPFAGLYLQDDWALASASPERFLHVADRVVTTRPIKGTRRRPGHAEADLFTKDALRESAKDQAENVMIVDLLRNDLSRVCQPGTVTVPQLCTVETYATVQHLVSEIRGVLEPAVSIWDLLAATWPGGSIVGAPKVRAMEILAELEPTVRGPYTGSLFYVTPEGNADSSLLIRTFVAKSGVLTLGVGGGIVTDSDPRAEYEETWHKAAGMLRALEPVT